METKVTVICQKSDDELKRLKAKNVVEIVEAAQKSKSKCSVTRNGKTVEATSILFLMSLGLRNGDVVTIKCDDEDCVNKICEVLIENEIQSRR